MKFPVLLHKDVDSDYGVTFPDVPGCFSSGTSVAEALENAHKALTLHFDGLLADGDALPKAQSVDVHRDNPDFTGGIWAVVDFEGGSA